MKKKILIVIESLRAAGGEKSLITLLSLVDYSKYEIDLQLFSFSGEFLPYLSPEVKVLPPFKYTKYLNGDPQFHCGMWLAKTMYSLSQRLFGKSAKTKARLYWRFISHYIDKNDRLYDAAIGYGQCLPTFFVVDKTRAKVKLGWVNCIYHLDGYEKNYQRRFYNALDKIVAVSTQALDHFKTVFPQMEDKMFLMPDLINPGIISIMSQNGQSFEDGFSSTRLLTVARLNKNDKGYDITLEACKILKERGLLFKWYAIGRGEYRSEMEDYIRKHNLWDYFVFLGTTPNPYPFIKDCTMYVQTSRHEGFGLSIAEARILNRPVVTTDFDSVFYQMIPGKNGLVVPQDPVAVADAIEKLLMDKQLYDSIIEYQRQEKKGNTEEIERFYALLER